MVAAAVQFADDGAVGDVEGVPTTHDAGSTHYS
jgi:hypothetical protein